MSQMPFILKVWFMVQFRALLEMTCNWNHHIVFQCELYCRFFSRKRDASGDRLKKGRTPEPAMDGDVSPERKPVGMGRTSTLHMRTPQVRVSQVSICTRKLYHRYMKYSVDFSLITYIKGMFQKLRSST